MPIARIRLMNFSGGGAMCGSSDRGSRDLVDVEEAGAGDVGGGVFGPGVAVQRRAGTSWRRAPAGPDRPDAPPASRCETSVLGSSVHACLLACRAVPKSERGDLGKPARARPRARASERRTTVRFDVRRPRRRLSRVPQQALLLALPVALGLGLALVGHLLALGDADLQLRDALVVEVEHQRHKRHPLALRLVPEAATVPCGRPAACAAAAPRGRTWPRS